MNQQIYKYAYKYCTTKLSKIYYNNKVPLYLCWLKNLYWSGSLK